MTVFRLALALAAVLSLAAEQIADEQAGAGADSAAARLHAPFSALLAAHVRDGVVDYTGLAERRAELDAYLRALGQVDPDTLDRPARFAFWINAYNAFTLKLILERHPGIESIKDIPGRQRWDAARWPVNGKRLSLTAIEHEILRPMGDPRIHFAINCASSSCPDLRAEAYLPETLDAQLDDATRRFLRDPRKGLRTEVDEGFFGTDYELHVSALFDWFEEDFEGPHGGVIEFVLPYASEEDAAFIRRHRDDLDLEHLDYDWGLNGR